MGAIGGLLGTSGGANGTGFATPTTQVSGLQNPVTSEQLGQSQAGANGSLAQQNALLQALQANAGAGGIGANQAQAYGQGQQMYNQAAGNNGFGTQAAATGAQQSLLSALQGANGIGTQQSAVSGLQGVAGQQAATAAQLQGIANGTGPNPALAQLRQTTGQNVANQAALMAGQRGASANVGLMARQAAQQGAATQQQAVGQGATLEAQQQLGALGQLGAQQQAQAATQQAIGGIGSNLTGAQQTGVNNLFGQGATTVGQQANALNINAGIANQQVGNYLGASGTNLAGNLTNAGQQLQGMGGYNTTLANLQGNVNSANTSLANTNMQGQQAMLGGMMNGAGQALSSMSNGPGGARGGMVKGRKRMADGGDVDPMEAPYPMPEGQGPLMPQPQPGPVATPTPQTGYLTPFGNFLAGNSNTADFLQQDMPSSQPNQAQDKIDQSIQAPPQMGYGSQMLYNGASKMSEGAAKAGMSAAGARGGKVPAMLSEGEVYVPPEASTSPARGAAYVANAKENGGEIKAQTPDQRAVKHGNSYANDKIPEELEEGGVVIPRSVMQSDNPISGAAKFIEAILVKKGKK